MSGRDVTGGTLVVLLAVVVFLGLLAWAILPYVQAALERLEQVAP